MSELVRYEAACRALAECKAVDEVKAWADKAAAMQAYGRMAKDKTLEVDAAEIRIRAERRLGEMLSAQKDAGAINRGGAGTHATGREERPVGVPPTLAEVGISKDLSSRAQKLAAVPEDEFEEEVGQWRERVSQEGERVSARLEAAGEREIRRRRYIHSKSQQEAMDALKAVQGVSYLDTILRNCIAVLRDQPDKVDPELIQELADVVSAAVERVQAHPV